MAACAVFRRHRKQIESYVANVVRSKVPKLTLDEVFNAKDEIASSVKEELEQNMKDFGFFIHNALVTDIDPDIRVKNAMNVQNESKRLQ